MKKILIIILFVTQHVCAQQFNNILNAPVKKAQLSDFKGKIVIVDFWATWCGSCIAAMPHLQQLQTKYKNELQVIAVNDETVIRTAAYLKSKPSNLWFAVDTGEIIAAQYPHQLIPHDILIDADGKVIAATDPEQITENVIDSLLHHREVHVVAKIDDLENPDDLIKHYFFAADSTQNRFMMQGSVKGGQGFSTVWLNDPVFSGRRLTCFNLSLATLYRLANNDFPYNRTIDSTRSGKNPPSYCLDIIVKNKAGLLPVLRKELAARFDIHAGIVNMKKNVQVLTISNQDKFKTIPRNATGKRTYYSRHGEIDQQCITMSDFAKYLESYGTGAITLDSTVNHDKLDIKFTFQPENPQSLTDVLAGMGLVLKKQQCMVPMLVLYKQDTN
jgi:thiol-disulfide isomerase/thioredoxin